MNSNNKIFIAGSLANGACFSMILPLLAPFIRQLGLTELQGGALVSAGALVMAISAIYISKQTQKFSIYQLLSIGFIGMAITWGLFAAVLSYGLSYAMSFIVLFSLLILTRASTGFFMAMPQIALQSYVMTAFHSEQERSQNMAKFGALNSLGVVIGPLATTLLLLTWSMLTPLWGAVAILTAMAAWIVLGFQGKQASQTQERDETTAKLQDVPTEKLQWSKLGIWLLLGFSLYVAIVTLNLTAGFYIQDRFHFDTYQSAMYFSQCSLIVGIALVLMQLAISKWFKWSIKPLLWVGLVTMVLGLLLSLSASQIWTFQAAYIFYGIAVACLIPAFTTGAAQTAPTTLQTKIASLCTATQALSFVFAPLLSTGLYQWNQHLPYYFLLALMTGLMLYFSFKHIQANKDLSSVA
ncbi:MFS transporter [Acinetobacter johnsonii]|uniref:MFS transporter n=1 Tax=Acinetobacter johnsonii TaxID=40214 RepID=A0A3R9FRI1_ACIJO|nr:MFS transporter [Acinetobacter johnsonii]MDH0834815.1 MFS transporter [Acinetobacter johnsonii]MDH0838692.1 MFS transporter [Acinetobacter johnsonii]RSE25086.1 MFS transporter [Acinetobacter johnsonii]